MTKNRTTIAVLGCWMTACALGMGVLSHYHFKPGDALAAPAVLTSEELGTQSFANGRKPAIRNPVIRKPTNHIPRTMATRMSSSSSTHDAPAQEQP